MGANSAIPYGDGRREILDATIALIAEAGVHGFAMRQVSTRAAMVVGSITHHFKDRATLILTATTVHVDRVETTIDALLDDEGSDPDELEQAVLTYFANRQNTLIGAELRLAATRNPDLRQLNDRLLDNEARLITTYQKREDMPVRPALLSEIHAAGLATASQVAAPSKYSKQFTRTCRRLLRAT